jgi:hypothetical protein
MLFRVEGPVNTATSKCVWKVRKEPVDRVYDAEFLCEGENEVEYTVPDSLLTNRIEISCYVYSLVFTRRCSGQWICEWGWFWEPTDSREWEVRIDPSSAPVVMGDYIIKDIADKQMLTGYDEIKGYLKISGKINNLQGLDELTKVNGNMRIEYNSALTNLSGLGNTAVGGDLFIYDNESLKSLSGLENITFGGDLSIRWNSALKSLGALGGITSVSRDMVISSNDALTSLGMTGLQNVGDNFRISYNPMLCSSLAEELMNQVLAGGGIGEEKRIEGNKVCTTS